MLRFSLSCDLGSEKTYFPRKSDIRSDTQRFRRLQQEPAGLLFVDCDRVVEAYHVGAGQDGDRGVARAQDRNGDVDDSTSLPARPAPVAVMADAREAFFERGFHSRVVRRTGPMLGHHFGPARIGVLAQAGFALLLLLVFHAPRSRSRASQVIAPGVQ